MPIDRAALVRDLRACIADWPVTIRFPIVTGPQILCAYSGSSELLAVIEPGYIDSQSGSITALIDDFTGGLPVDDDLLEVFIRGAAWRTFKVTSVRGSKDPNGTDLNLTIGSPDE